MSETKVSEATSSDAQPVVEGWFTDGENGAALIGTKCTSCQTPYFPKQTLSCRNPECRGTEFEEVELSRKGRIWSFTNAGYAPPEPYIARDPHEPFVIAAVELEVEKMVVLGQMVRGTAIEDLSAGDQVELVIEEIYIDNGESRTSWKWKPVAS